MRNDRIEDVKFKQNKQLEHLNDCHYFLLLWKILIHIKNCKRKVDIHVLVMYQVRSLHDLRGHYVSILLMLIIYFNLTVAWKHIIQQIDHMLIYLIVTSGKYFKVMGRNNSVWIYIDRYKFRSLLSWTPTINLLSSISDTKFSRVSNNIT